MSFNELCLYLLIYYPLKSGVGTRVLGIRYSTEYTRAVKDSYSHSPSKPRPTLRSSRDIDFSRIDLQVRSIRRIPLTIECSQTVSIFRQFLSMLHSRLYLCTVYSVLNALNTSKIVLRQPVLTFKGCMDTTQPLLVQNCKPIKTGEGLWEMPI